jgi:DNA-directed RNA polymerase specialized sigma24 family protein
VSGPERGGGRKRVPLEEAEGAEGGTAGTEAMDWVGLDGALAALEKQDPELAELVSLRYFAGLSVDQAAAALGLSARTIDRDWAVARAFLQHHLSADRGDPAVGDRR